MCYVCSENKGAVTAQLICALCFCMYKKAGFLMARLICCEVESLRLLSIPAGLPTHVARLYAVMPGPAHVVRACVVEVVQITIGQSVKAWWCLS